MAFSRLCRAFRGDGKDPLWPCRRDSDSHPAVEWPRPGPPSYRATSRHSGAGRRLLSRRHRPRRRLDLSAGGARSRARVSALLVFATFPDVEVARKIVRTLVEERLVA